MAKRVQPIGVKSSAFTSNAHAAVHGELRKSFGKVDQSSSFVCEDGTRLNSLWDLAEHLKTISPESYKSHANDSKNDFASWLRDVHGNHVLADRMISARSAHHAAKIVANHVVSALHEAAHR